MNASMMQVEGTVSSDEMDYELSALQDKVLVLLPIPSALLSIIGSGTIIFMTVKMRYKEKLTPYTRLLLGLSVFDIVFSVTEGVSGFMRPQDSYRAYAFGNDMTCKVNGFFTQLSYGSFCYSSMLSFYFLLKVRYRWTNEDLSKWVEPLMHAFAVGFPLVSATAGAILDAYSETVFGLGCWINARGSNDKTILGWAFGGWMIMFVFVSLVTNNLLIWRHVKQYARDPQKSRHGEKLHFSTKTTITVEDTIVPASDLADSENSSARDQRQEADALRKKQLQRLRLISSQAFLFVASFFACAIWAFLLGLAEAKSDNNSTEDEKKMLVDNYALLILDSMFIPLQGFLNMFVYLRPKYVKIRDENPSEGRPWVVKRAILGNAVVPKSGNGNPGSGDNKAPQNPITPRTKDPNIMLVNKEGAEFPKPGSLSQSKGSDSMEVAPNKLASDTEEILNANKPGLPYHQTRKVSSLTVHSESTVEADLPEDGRWEGSSHLQSHSWIPLKKAQRRTSKLASLGSSGMEPISEISQAQFEDSVRMRYMGSTEFEAIDEDSEYIYHYVVGHNDPDEGKSGNARWQEGIDIGNGDPEGKWEPANTESPSAKESHQPSQLSMPRRRCSEFEVIDADSESMFDSVIRHHSPDESNTRWHEDVDVGSGRGRWETATTESPSTKESKSSQLSMPQRRSSSTSLICKYSA